MKWEPGLSTGIAYRRPILEVLETIASAGFRVLEISTAPAHLNLEDTAGLRALASRMRDLDLRAYALHAPFGPDLNISSHDPAVRERSLEHLVKAADALQLLGGRLYVVHPGGEDQRWVWDRERRLEWSVAMLERLWKACNERGLVLVLETPLPHLLGGQLADFAWILERLPPEGTGVCVDTSHTALGGTLFEAIARFSARLVHVQASDNRGVSDDHLPPGDGVLHWDAVVAALVAAGYRGVFMMEVSGEDEVGDRASRSMAFARRALDG